MTNHIERIIPVSKGSIFTLLVLLLVILPAKAEQTVSYTYNAQGLIATVDGARTDVLDLTTFEYDAQGNRTKIINALGHITQITAYDSSGRPLNVIDPNGATIELSYDQRGRLTRQTQEGNSTQLSYDATGNIKQITLADGQMLSYDYDPAHRLIGYRDGLGNQASYTLDTAGNRLSETLTDSNNTATRYHEFIYDKLSRLIGDISASEQRISLAYDNNNNQTQKIDAKGNPAQFRYDALNRLTKTTNTNKGETHFHYDKRDNLISVTDPNGQSTHYDYDTFDQLIGQDSPDTGLTTYTVDSAGNRLSQTDAKGITSTYIYDALNRLTSVNYPDTTLNVSYQYDENEAGQHGIGRLTTQTDASGITKYTYDKRGNQVTVTSTRGTDTFSTQYAYNEVDQLTQISYPDQRAADYHYDVTGRISSITTTDNHGQQQTLLTDIQYQPFGSMKSQTYGNGLTTKQITDLDYRQTQLDTPNVLTRNYDYDANSNITDIDGNENEDVANNSNSQHLIYDNLDRLIQANSQDNGQIDYSYDATHNRIQRTIDKQGQTEQQNILYENENNQLSHLITETSQDYQYDENGNLIDNGDYQFNYGDNNRLQSVSQNSNPIAQYTYNAQGQRTSKTVNHKTTQYLYNLTGQLLAEITGGKQEQWLLLQKQAEQLDQDIVQNQFQKQQQESKQTSQQTRIKTLEKNQETAQITKTKLENQANRQTRKLLRSQLIVRVLTRLQQRYDYYWWKAIFQPLITVYQQQARQQQQRLDQTQQQIIEQQDILEALIISLEQVKQDLSRTQQQIKLLQQQLQSQQQQLTEINQQIQEVEQQGNPAETHSKNYLYAQGQLIAITETEAVYYVHNDHLPTPQVITDQNQQIVWQATYTPFGQATVQIQTISNNVRFPGQYFDAETGLHYNYFRYYDPETGRYITSDPIGLQGGLNTYAYVGGNPLRYSDPKGLFVWDILDFAFFTQSLLEYYQCSSTENAFNLGLDAIGLLPGIPALGTLRRVGDAVDSAQKIEGRLNLFKLNAPTSMKQIGWKDGDSFLNLLDKGSAHANWKQNSSRLREEMRKGDPIFDSHIDPLNGKQIPTGGFLGAERNLLENQGWRYNSTTNAYHPPSD